MKVIFDIGHPAHVHYFKYIIFRLEEKGHKVLITAREKPIIIRLLKRYEIKFIGRGLGKDTLLGKLSYLIMADLKVFFIALKFKPDIFVSFTTPYSAHTAFLFGKPHIAFNDTEHSDKFNKKIVYPFCDVIFTPKSYLNELGEKQIRLNCIMEYFYLNPKYFRKSDRIKSQLGLNEVDEYIIIRFVSWKAHHDIGEKGIDLKTALDLIEILKNRFKVFISCEGEIPNHLKKYELKIEPDLMHDVIANAKLFIGESATMASESVMLGVNAIYVNSIPLMGYLKIANQVGVLQHFKDTEGLAEYVKNFIKDNDFNIDDKVLKLTKKFIQPIDLISWFIDTYPESKKVLLKDNQYPSSN